MSAFTEAEFPADVLSEILIWSGSWSLARNHAVEKPDGAALSTSQRIVMSDNIAQRRT